MSKNRNNQSNQPNDLAGNIGTDDPDPGADTTTGSDANATPEADTNKPVNVPMSVNDLEAAWNSQRSSIPEGTFRTTIDKCKFVEQQGETTAIVYELMVVQPGTQLDGMRIIKRDEITPQSIEEVKRNVSKLLGRVPVFSELSKDLETLIGNVVNITTYRRKDVFMIDFV